jgi:dihydrodipicolinate synthase/N-acetylneuraminate lyase
MAQPTWRGVFPAVTSKFTTDDRLDIEEMERCFALQIDAGVHGLIVCGSLGEASTLESDEKIEILKAAVRVAKGRLPVLLSVAEGATKRASRLAEMGARAGATGFMVLPGIPYRSDPRETVAHYRTIAQAGALPIMIYNNPLSYGVDITPQLLSEFAADTRFVAIKESSDDVRRITQIFNAFGNRFQLFTGVDNLALESLAVGAHGWVAGLVCAFPAETVAIYELAQAGRLTEALTLYRWFQPLLDLDVSTKLVQNIKLVEALVTGSNDRCREPRLPLSGDARRRVESIVAEALSQRPQLPRPSLAKTG